MKLYFNPRSRAVIAKWMLDEAGVEYEIIPIDLRKHEHKTPEFLKVNPAGKLPALVDGDTRVFENAALCLYVADRYPQARLAPAIDAPERGRYLSLMVYSTSQLEPSAADHMTKTATLPQRGWTEYPLALDAMERELGNGPYLFGDWFTAADVMIGSIFIYQRMLGARTDRPVLDAYVDRLMARPKGMKLG
ncbi:MULTISPECIES: glutathione S-transferase family protein [Corallococcus]|uniref:glutathione S-transferase family protein n=1 Tax=Corallococcus TaxID=83461 RepID=UPI00117E5DE8|nr:MULTISPECIES: glutathione S-transferase family protein [Corallococcus]NBD09647.1 glutathione S-transferase family protein [Corallococcus silvisoli]TSC24106.1 glutathione S-transferase family protein [Corallococcus sp. Z5C101001]